ncbi:MAG TPA: glycosyltransferase family 39 protein [Chloroflexota bacterium]|nr:glycosyltransferase family 39 protein [Chloroflexota bacterium]
MVCVAAALRLWQLGTIPPGLYRDEAFNGLDALRVLDGELAVFFTANNGREPLYIYLTTFFVALMGRSVTAVRLGAALVGVLTVLPVFLLAREWFGWRVGLFAAWLWAVTLWPVHLSHIGLRIILLPACLALIFWLGTLAYRRQQWWLWLAAGLVYGLTFYTYLAVRFTPLLLLGVGLFMLWRRGRERLWSGAFWFVGGTAVALLPLALFYATHLEMLLGRSGQVSIFNPDINGGDPWGLLLRQIALSFGLFIWRGDTILRHNPAGRPLFDPLMAIPFLIGLAWCVRRWRQPAVAVTLLWVAVMLGVTILAEDAPHFLRAAGILPAALFIPALGLNWLWEWPKLPAIIRQLGVVVLLASSLWLTVRDYTAYGRDPQTALLFESAAVEMAAQLNAEEVGTAVYLDSWFWDESAQKGWPSLPFLADLDGVTFFRPEFGLPPAAPGQPVSLYTWQFGDLSFVPRQITPPVLVTVHIGELARGDLEETAYPLYARYHARPLAADPAAIWPEAVNFDNQLWLRRGAAIFHDSQTVQVDLYWEGQTAVAPHLTVFVQLVGPDGVLAQVDAPPGGSEGPVRPWQADWWRPGVVLHERRTLQLPQPYDPASQRLIVGLYDPVTAVRLPVLDENENPAADSWEIIGIRN